MYDYLEVYGNLFKYLSPHDTAEISDYGNIGDEIVHNIKKSLNGNFKRDDVDLIECYATIMTVNGASNLRNEV